MRGVASTSISEPSRFSAFSSADGCDNRRTRVRPRRVEQRADEDECLSHQAERRLHWGAGERSNVCFAPLHLVPFGLPARQLVGVSPDEGEMACTNGIANRVKSVGEVVMDAVPNISEAGHRVREVGASAERGVLTPPPPRVFGYSTARAPAPCDLFIERVRPVEGLADVMSLQGYTAGETCPAGQRLVSLHSAKPVQTRCTGSEQGQKRAEKSLAAFGHWRSLRSSGQQQKPEREQ